MKSAMPKQQQNELHAMRHSLAHVLAQAVLRLYPETKISIGPPIDTGCYYDFLFKEPISDEDFAAIEKEMRKIINQAQTFAVDHLPVDDAIKFWKSKKQQFKVELIEDLKKAGETEVTNYRNIDVKGEEMFVDLCKGGHVENLKEIPADAFKIMSLAGAYFRGDEKREQLTRIYVAAFASKEALKAYLHMLEEAKKYDHRKLGRELDLFVFSDIVGPGLPLWTPRGTIITDELEKLAREKEAERGYLRVRTPHVGKSKLYERTGHLKHFCDVMFPVMKVDEDEEYFLKPMNCPHHHEIFASSPRSYRDLPMRLAEYGQCYRYEDSGALFGLMRVRSLSMNDAHIYCTEEQFESEFLSVIDLYKEYFQLFNIQKYVMRLSLHDPAELGKKYVNEPVLWKKTEEMVRRTMMKANCEYVEAENEAAFYGPKIDVEVWSAIGREFTLATNQVDFDVPGRVGLRYIDRDGSEKTPLCIHRAPLSTHERFIGFLIEHFKGMFPLWLSPVQVGLLPVATPHEKYAEELRKILGEKGVRVQIFYSEESLGKRIREGEKLKIPYLLVLGDEEVTKRSAAVRNVKTKEQTTMLLDEFSRRVREEIETRSL